MENDINMSALFKLTDEEAEVSLFGVESVNTTEHLCITPKADSPVIHRYHVVKIVVHQFGDHPDLHTFQQSVQDHLLCD